MNLNDKINIYYYLKEEEQKQKPNKLIQLKNRLVDNRYKIAQRARQAGILAAGIGIGHMIHKIPGAIKGGVDHIKHNVDNLHHWAHTTDLLN